MKPQKLEPILMLLFGSMVFFTGILFASEIWFASDSQLFQVVAGILTGITGAFLGRIKPSKSEDPTTTVSAGPAGTVTVNQPESDKP